jgi:hypothetical protein
MLACEVGGLLMADVLFVALSLAFFVVSWLYVRACDRV